MEFENYCWPNIFFFGKFKIFWHIFLPLKCNSSVHRRTMYRDLKVGKLWHNFSTLVHKAHTNRLTVNLKLHVATSHLCTCIRYFVALWKSLPCLVCNECMLFQNAQHRGKCMQMGCQNKHVDTLWSFLTLRFSLPDFLQCLVFLLHWHFLFN